MIIEGDLKKIEDELKQTKGDLKMHKRCFNVM